MEYRLRELYEVSNGLSKSGDCFGSGYPFLSFSTVFNNYFIPAEIKNLVQSTDKEQSTFSIKEGDVFVTRTSETADELGMSCVALKDYPKATYNGFCKRLRPITNNTYPTYMGYYFRTPQFRANFIKIASLITRASLRNEDLLKFKVELPTVEKQKQIAEILYTYDKLIENNSKRIKLLEQMAENLYKEWFVRFRFPNHENTEFENGIPKGWEIKKLFDVANVKYGYAFKSDLFCDDKTLNPVVRIRDIPNNKTNTFTTEECDEKYLINDNAIVIGMDGIFHMCLWNGGKAFLNQRVVEIESKIEDLSNLHLYYALYPQVKYWEQTISGTTVAHLGDKHLKKMTVLLPSKDICKCANDILSNIMLEKNKLFNQNQNLIKQRDLLLPRLMSGKLEV